MKKMVSQADALLALSNAELDRQEAETPGLDKEVEDATLVSTEDDNHVIQEVLAQAKEPSSP